MTLKVPWFAIRCRSTIKIDDMGRLATKALGCELRGGLFRKQSALTGTLLGMSVGLYIEGEELRMEGEVNNYDYLDFLDANPAEIESLNISAIVRDALIVAGCGEWYAPDPQ